MNEINIIYDVKKEAYTGVDISSILGMSKDELIENGDRLKNGSDEQIKAGLNLWMMALTKDQTDAAQIGKIAKYQNKIGDEDGALKTYETGIKAIEQKGNGDKAALGNLYLGKAQLKIYSRGNKDYEQAQKDIETSAELTDEPVDQSLMITIEEGIARQKRRKNKA